MSSRAGPLRLAAALLVGWLGVAERPMGAMADREAPAIDVRFRSGIPLEEPLRLLPPELRVQVTKAAPLVTLDESELGRIGAERMARWFRLSLAPGTDVETFVARLKRLDSVESAERAPRPAPMEP